MKISTIFYFLLIIPILFTGCANQEKNQDEEQEQAEDQAQKWINLLDAEHADHWRGYNGETLPPGWTINNGMLYFDTELKLEQDYTGGSDVIYGGQKFENFELSVEWKIPEGGNSGIFYHVNEGHKSPSGTAPEYQLIDDEHYADIHDLVGYNSQFGAEHPELLQDWQMTGADYAMHPVEIEDKVLHPTGEWNTSKIVVAPGRTEHWLNGKKLLSFDPGSEDWQKRKNSGKWDGYPDYGKYNSGYIAFQDHGSPLWFRNVKIRPIE
ncbi:DUF1080 domain-containing protein [Membranicola marinus]|uniref:DUF1080 domain-containing protein n=1 Tax=Membranihabitans marinus TaxID=1227546 RepID=A0A953HRD2_9BACT|nr:DUF1080 domain-containing protein [Membranihabitans marinus]MBY5956886.1 DUF1080 domain-containing protein [Membranihabitans marinus]